MRPRPAPSRRSARACGPNRRAPCAPPGRRSARRCAGPRQRGDRPATRRSYCRSGRRPRSPGASAGQNRVGSRRSRDGAGRRPGDPSTAASRWRSSGPAARRSGSWRGPARPAARQSPGVEAIIGHGGHRLGQQLILGPEVVRRRWSGSCRRAWPRPTPDARRPASRAPARPRWTGSAAGAGRRADAWDAYAFRSSRAPVKHETVTPNDDLGTRFSARDECQHRVTVSGTGATSALRADANTGRVALITGGGTGIGRATAIGLAATGASVIVCGRREDPLLETAAAIEGAGEHVGGWGRHPRARRGV